MREWSKNIILKKDEKQRSRWLIHGTKWTKRESMNKFESLFTSLDRPVGWTDLWNLHFLPFPKLIPTQKIQAYLWNKESTTPEKELSSSYRLSQRLRLSLPFLSRLLSPCFLLLPNSRPLVPTKNIDQSRLSSFRFSIFFEPFEQSSNMIHTCTPRPKLFKFQDQDW